MLIRDEEAPPVSDRLISLEYTLEQSIQPLALQLA
jgi:hypothetical protein